MKFEWILLAEGLGQDAKGAITAIGVNQNILIAPKLPTTTKRALLVSISEEDSELQLGDVFTFKMSVVAPSGEVLAAQTGEAPVAGRPWPGMPATINIPAEFRLNIAEYGTYRLGMRVSIKGETIEAQLPLYVVSSFPEDGNPMALNGG